MPLYEYSCPVHGIIEIWAGIRDKPVAFCTIPDPDSPMENCDQPLTRLISLPAGYVIEPKGMYVPAPGLDKKGRWNETKISPRAAERADRIRRDTMLATRARAIKQGQTPRFE